ncbi:MAG: beta galactosidase jelly roll domain-containing protein [Bacteroidales bacterium]|nr:beta galactosidase jelly roll domain-containing protein [Bacteroidales bacterium]
MVVVALGLCFTLRCEAKVKLPACISNGMVLQRDQPVGVWGWAEAGENVRVAFQGKTHAVQADTAGNWEITLPPMKAGGPYEMSINETKITDILVGDVWFCSGQSNMELPVSRVMDRYRDEMLAFSNPEIRHIKTPLTYNFHQPQSDIPSAAWKKATPDNIQSFSAVALFFAQAFYETTNVPVGLINSSVGGSPAEAWISEEQLRAFPQYLNEKRICESDHYVASVKQLYAEARALWVATLNRSDAGLIERQAWRSPAYDDSGWTSLSLFDSSWTTDGVNPVNGAHWFRKTVEIPKPLADKRAVLRLGCIADADSVFVNGVFAGTVSYRYPPRIYDIPENLLHEGANTIAIRLISYSGRPEFVRDKPYKLVFDSEEIDLRGEWKYRLGVRMPTMSGETFFHYKPAGLYNGMVAPFLNYAIKGALWYQGESNTGRYNEYFSLMHTLIDDWRTRWRQPDMPFLIVQLANFMEADAHPRESEWAALRDAQRRLAQEVPNTGLAVTIDIGEWNDIHPLNKKDVGKRLARQALRVAFGDVRQTVNGPVYQSCARDGNKIVLRFEDGTNDLQNVDQLHGFAIADDDGIFHWAEAIVEGRTVIVWNDSIPQPQTVRYAWGNNPADANLRNSAGLPASPFVAALHSQKD